MHRGYAFDVYIQYNVSCRTFNETDILCILKQGYFHDDLRGWDGGGFVDQRLGS